MFCPKCHAEYREGFDRCSDCDLPLAAALPMPDSEIELEKVFEAGEPALLAVAESLLADAGIDYLTKNENLQDFFAGGRLGTSSSLILGPAQFWVRREDAAEARSLLQSIESTPAPPPEEGPSE